MNTLVEERVIRNSLDHDVLHASARQMAASGGGLPAVIAGLQAEFGLAEEAASEVAAKVFGLQTMSLAELSEHSLALSLAPFSDFVRRHVLVLEAPDGYLVAAPNPLDGALRDWLEGVVPLARRLTWRLASASVLAAYLAREESRVRALDSGFGGESSEITHPRFVN